MSKSLAPAVLISLKETLSKIYWYKKDLISFIEYAIENNQIVATIDWSNQTKYESVCQLIDRMNKRNDIYFNDLLSLLRAVIDLNDFSHFDRLDGNDKEKYKRAAMEAVAALRKQCNSFFQTQKEDEKAKESKKQFILQQQKTLDYNRKIEEFKNRYYTIARLEPHARGYELEKFLNDLFFFFDLSPRSSFRVNGEQIDGAFTHDNTDYLLEAKWHDAPIERREIDVFSAVIERKLKTTLGLFISINGFVTAAVDSTYKYNSIILMDSNDLIQVLENRIRLPELIMRKRRHASETGESMYRVNV